MKESPRLSTTDATDIVQAEEEIAEPCPDPNTFLVMNGHNLHYVFPVQEIFCCPVEVCTSKFKNIRWTANKNSLERHINNYHRIRGLVHRFWCSVCRSLIAKTPSRHACLKDIPLVTRNRRSDPHKCSFCPFSHPTKSGLDVHLQVHRLERFGRPPELRTSTPQPQLPNDEQADVPGPESQTTSLPTQTTTRATSFSDSQIRQLTVSDEDPPLLKKYYFKL